MKTIFRTTVLLAALFTSLLLATRAKAQQSFINSKNETAMKTIQQMQENKETVRNLYENILNNRKFELLDGMISEKYTGLLGEKGVDGFLQPILPLIKAFPDLQWEVEDLIGEGNKVMVRQNWTGTHTGQLQAFAATQKTVTVSGTAVYEFENGRIIRVQIQTDRLGFLQQLGAVPLDLALLTDSAGKEEVGFIDKFFVPQNAMDEFARQMKINRDFIKNLPGFLEDAVFIQTGEDSHFIVITVARWKNRESVNAARNAVQEEYKRIGFDMPGFLKRLNITFERGLYNRLNQ